MLGVKMGVGLEEGELIALGRTPPVAARATMVHTYWLPLVRPWIVIRLPLEALEFTA